MKWSQQLHAWRKPFKLAGNVKPALKSINSEEKLWQWKGFCRVYTAWNTDWSFHSVWVFRLCSPPLLKQVFCPIGMLQCLKSVGPATHPSLYGHMHKGSLSVRVPLSMKLARSSHTCAICSLSNLLSNTLWASKLAGKRGTHTHTLH